MPTKTVKKSPAKKPAKKIVKSVAAPVAKPVFTDIPEPSRYCHCTKRKRNTILTCVSIIFFLLGMLVYHMFFCDGHHPRYKMKPQFVNGCIDVTSIKCPKMLEGLPMMDTDHDGCITKTELRAAKKMMRRHEKPTSDSEPAINVEDAIAPVAE